MIFGGMPYYLGYIDNDRSLAQNVDLLFFSSDGILKNEFNRLFDSVFTNPGAIKSIVKLLYTRNAGYTRKEITEKLKVTDGGTLSKNLNALLASDFVIKYVPFGLSMREEHYKLNDPFCLFYLHFVQNQTRRNEMFWQQNVSAQSVVAWRGYAFENVCFNHVEQIKKALGIAGVVSSNSAWSKRSDDEDGVQIDLLIHRNDNVINMCEMKFLSEDFIVNKAYYRVLLSRPERIKEVVSPKISIYSTLVTTFGLKTNEYSYWQQSEDGIPSGGIFSHGMRRTSETILKGVYIMRNYLPVLAACLAVGVFLAGCAGSNAGPNEQKESSPASSEGSGDSARKDKPGTDSPAVYFTSDISAEGLVKIYDELGWTPSGKTAVKISTGEPPASNYLRPELIGDLVKKVDGTIVECNTAYGGSRASSDMHRQVAEDHGFTEIADFDLMDEDGEIEWPMTGGARLDKVIVGSHAENYTDWVILSHFKGHAMAGFGGAIKNVGIGISSPSGKVYVHTAGTKTSGSIWYSDQDAWLEALAEMVSGFSSHVGKEHIIYINVMNRLSVDCDCDGNPAEPDIHDIGILASTDPVALDQACVDLIYQAEGNESLVKRMESLNGIHTLEHAEEIGLGSRTYRLVSIDD